MKKRLFAFIFVALGLSGAALIGSNRFAPAFAEGEDSITEDSSEIEPEEVELPCKVVLDAVEHGTVSADILEGNIGDICTLTIQADSLHLTESVAVNSVAITAGEDGYFRFALVEGENHVSVIFALNESVTKEFTEIISQVESKDWENLFTVKNLLTIISFLFDSGCIVALVSILKKYKKSKTVDREDVIKALKNAVPEQANALITSIMNETITPMLSAISEKQVNLQEALTKFTTILALMTEGTPESKAAILEELGSIKISDTSTIEDVKKYFTELIEKMNAEKEEIKKSLEELKQANEKAKAQIEASKVETSDEVGNII